MERLTCAMMLYILHWWALFLASHYQSIVSRKFLLYVNAHKVDSLYFHTKSELTRKKVIIFLEMLVVGERKASQQVYRVMRYDIFVLVVLRVAGRLGHELPWEVKASRGARGGGCLLTILSATVRDELVVSASDKLCGLETFIVKYSNIVMFYML